MQYIFSFSLVLLFMNTQTIFDFSKKASLNNWMIVDDVVMGGRSQGNFEINKQGHGVFYGEVSLENNGGFSSVRHNFKTMDIVGKKKLKLRVKGDGKRYQVRFKPSRNDYHSYIHYIETTGDWQEIEIPLADFYPSFRGRRLDMPNFDQQKLEELAFLIANYKAEKFKLLIDYIQVN